jgi:hypothetical protein
MEIPHEERNISLDPRAKQAFKDKGYDLLPVVEMGSTVITEYTGEPQLIEALVKEGYL